MRRAALLIAGSILIFGWVLRPIRAEGISMRPTYDSGDLLFVNRLSYTAAGPKRGDIVAIALAGERVYYVKRIVGLPLERVRILDGIVLVNRCAARRTVRAGAAAVDGRGSGAEVERVLRHRRQSRHERAGP